MYAYCNAGSSACVIGNVKILANVYQTTVDVTVKWIVMMAVMNLTAVSHARVYNHI